MPAAVEPTSPPTIPPDGRVLPVPGWHAAPTRSVWNALQALRERRWAGSGAYHKIEGKRYTYLGRLDMGDGPEDVVVKRFPHRPGLLGTMRAALHGTQARRQTEGARLLFDIGVPTAMPIFLYRSLDQKPGSDWLLLRQVPGKDILRHLADDDLTLRQQHTLARNLGKLLVLLRRQNRHNRDSKLSNLIRLPSGEVGVIDTVGVRERRSDTLRMLRDMLNEAIGTNTLPRRSLMMRCLRTCEHDPQRVWRMLERLAAEPRQRAPKTDPLTIVTVGE